MTPTPNRPVALWLYAWCALLVGLVVIGGITRLTESGLSITEWKPVTGILPPLTHAAWEEEFAKYRQIPEYREKNAGMTLPQFQRIFFWEYLHRLWARLLGLAFALPLAWFIVTKRVDRRLAGRLGLILLLVGAQGALGWYMVASGLVDRVDVSQYRLAAHLGLALLIYALALWTGAGLWRSPGTAGDPRVARPAAFFAAYVFLTIVAGAFVAGLDAGRAWNTFPLMGGSFVPAGYGQLLPAWRNAFDNPAAVQFHHRWLGIGAGLGALALAFWSRRSPAEKVRHWAWVVAGAAGLQVALGLLTLLLMVPIPVAALHQLGAVILLTSALLLAHASRAQG
ncbi:MAG TPA: COX15/CtaA family protein [Gemmatimonadales bacterium]|nr:COX15/CtaA family protein [Gemmatimonadales bacterium]